MHQLVLHNGEVRSANNACVSVGKVGYLNGWGVFSTIRVLQGVLFAFERHYRRLQRDSKILRVPFAFELDELRQILLRLIEANAAWNSVLRVAVVRNQGGTFEGPAIAGPADLVAFTADLQNWGASARLTYEPNARFGSSQFAGMKTTSWAHNLSLYERTRADGFDEAVLLNEHGSVSECTSANIFSIRGQRVFTPPLSSSGCLPGVTRAILLEEVVVNGISIEERELTPSELETSDCTFITSSTRDLLPVQSIDGHELRQQRQVLGALQRAFAARLAEYVTHVSSSAVPISSFIHHEAS